MSYLEVDNIFVQKMLISLNIIFPGANVFNNFKFATYAERTLWLYETSHMTIINQSECIASV